MAAEKIMEELGKKSRKKMQPIATDASKEIAQYYQSMIAEQCAVKHYPEWDHLRREPILDLMRVGREMLVADGELKMKRLEYDNRRQYFAEQWEKLRENETLLNKSFVKFDEFVKKNKEKRERAERKINNEKERQQIRELEIDELERSLEQLEKAQVRMQSYVEKYKPFQKYLENLVVNSERDFQTVGEIFNRYETLLAAKARLLQQQDDNLHIMEDASVQLQKITEGRAQKMLDLNNKAARLQARLEKTRARALHWESVVCDVMEAASRKEREDAQVRASIFNLYKQICQRKGQPMEAKKDDLEQQLYHVNRTILELKKIVRAAKMKARKEQREKERNQQAGINTAVKQAQDSSIAAAPSRRESTRTLGTSISGVRSN